MRSQQNGPYQSPVIFVGAAYRQPVHPIAIFIKMIGRKKKRKDQTKLLIQLGCSSNIRIHVYACSACNYTGYVCRLQKLSTLADICALSVQPCGNKQAKLWGRSSFTFTNTMAPDDVFHAVRANLGNSRRPPPHAVVLIAREPSFAFHRFFQCKYLSVLSVLLVIFLDFKSSPGLTPRKILQNSHFEGGGPLLLSSIPQDVKGSDGRYINTQCMCF